MRAFFLGSNADKAAFRTPQDGERVLSHPGYLTPSPGWNELFEVRRSRRDPSYRFPPGCEAACVRLFDLLREECLRWLALLSEHLCGDANCLAQLAHTDSGPATMRVLHYDQVPDLAEQIAAIPRNATDRRHEAERTLMAGFPTHTDGTLLTLAPRASVSGLAVRDYSSRKWLRAERAMEEDEAVLFGGDPLAFVSRSYFPACMHRPDGLEMARAAPAVRLSTPFFLYPDGEATLDSRHIQAALRAQDGSELLAPTPEQLPVRDFSLNVGNCREQWPWKLGNKYYEGLVLCRDSDAFPGRKLEGDMLYGDDDHGREWLHSMTMCARDDSLAT